jgi:glutamate formiminotransferase
VHRDADHGRSVFTLAGEPGALAPAVVAGAREAVARIDLAGHAGVHPHVGAMDVAPIVFRTPPARGAACAEALVLGDLLARELDLPVFLYGALAGGRTRAELRRGGPAALAARMAAGELAADFGPVAPRAGGRMPGATLVAARPPLVAFNLVLGATLAEARAVAAELREGGPAGLPGLRALGLELERQGVVQLSTNVEDPVATPLRVLVAAVRERVPVREAELVGLAPAVAFEGFPEDVPIPGFDPRRHLLERVLG